MCRNDQCEDTASIAEICLVLREVFLKNDGGPFVSHMNAKAKHKHLKF